MVNCYSKHFAGEKQSKNQQSTGGDSFLKICQLIVTNKFLERCHHRLIVGFFYCFSPVNFL